METISFNGRSVAGFALADEAPKAITGAGGFFVGGFMTLVGGFIGGVAAVAVGAALNRDEPVSILVPIGGIIGGGIGAALAVRTANRQIAA